MTQAEINRAVAFATGESPREISHLGFGLADPLETEFDPEPSYPPSAVDWDELESWRPALFP